MRKRRKDMVGEVVEGYKHAVRCCRKAVDSCTFCLAKTGFHLHMTAAVQLATTPRPHADITVQLCLAGGTG